MDDQLDSYYYYDGLEEASISFPYPEEIYTPLVYPSWDGEMATSDDWIETWEFIKSLKGE